MKPLVIKIGGATLEKASALKALLVEIAKLEDQQVVLVLRTSRKVLFESF